MSNCVHKLILLHRTGTKVGIAWLGQLCTTDVSLQQQGKNDNLTWSIHCFQNYLLSFLVQMEEVNMFLEQECHQVRIYLTLIVLFDFIHSIKLFKVTREEWKVVAHEIGHGFGT